MPAASISNGHTGPLKFANRNDVLEYVSLIRMGAEGTDCKQMARESIGRHLHVVEFWMPGGCNLHCKHCYVASWPERKALASADYAELTNRMVRAGFVDVVIPGMEPLLRPETWVVTEAAHSAGARSIGMTTNATLLKRRLKLVLDSPLTVINVSLDGPQAIHDDIRGKGVYKIAMDGVAALRKASRTVRIISNCTVNRLNLRSLPKVATLAGDHDLTFAAFHPFERSAEVDNSLEVTAAQTVDGYEALRTVFEQGQTGSIVLEMESSRLDVLLEMSERGWFVDMDLLSDETGFLFYARRNRDALLLVNLMAYPHHYIRTLRIADDGGMSSCRGMAQSGWAGIGNLRRDAVGELLTTPQAHNALAHIWSEFKEAQSRAPISSMECYLRGIEAALTAQASAYTNMRALAA